jgi:hypothetical protein
MTGRLVYAMFWLVVWMLRFLFVGVVLMLAVYVWMGLGIAWLVSPNKTAVRRAARSFNGRVRRLI